MPNPVVHFEIIGSNPKTLAEFYRSAFDWKIDDVSAGGDMPEYIMARPDGTERPEGGINGGIGAAMPGYQGHVTFYIGVDDAGAALEKVEKLGATRIMGPEQVPNGPVIGLFKDPEGHTIGVLEVKM